MKASIGLACSFGILTLFLGGFAPGATAYAGTVTQSSSASTTSACSAEIASQLNSLLELVNDSKAAQVAEQSAQFLTAVGGSGYQVVTVYGIGTYTAETCGAGMTLGQVIVAFNLQGQTVTSGNITAPVGITVFENPQLTAVTSVTINRIIDGFSYYSGYEASYSTDTIYSSEITYYAPSASYNSECYHEFPYECVMSPWSGLDNDNGTLVQDGLNINYTCTSGGSCGSENLGAFWTWLGPDHTSVAHGCSDITYPVSVGDQITDYEANGLFTGGDGNSHYYIMSIQDATAGWACQPSWQDVGAVTPAINRGLSIIEMPMGGTDPIPTGWSMDISSNIICYTTSTSSCVYFSASGVTTYPDTMYNYCAALGHDIYNINLGGTITAGEYNQAYNNNCIF
jgi:hypothetical protein